ncbi:MAG: class I SAM-dependent rRNA methyltransferase, partial [Burkholderiales bacterium]
MKYIIIKSGREKSLLRRHPWVFSGAIKNIGAAQSGDIVKIVAEDGRYLATAAFSAASQIAARVLSFDERVVIDDAFYRQRIAAAILRRASLASQSTAYRLIHGESDGLPGVVADRYGDTVVLQLSTAGVEPNRLLLAQLLIEVTGARTIYERSDADVRKLEGLGERNGLVLGEALSAPIQIVEGGMTIEVDIVNGHKTGFYLDQRDNRALTMAISKDKDVLNCFCYSATMSTSAMLGGAKSVVSIDSSAPALVSGRHIAALNKIDPNTMEWVEADVFAHLRKLRDRG